MIRKFYKDNKAAIFFALAAYTLYVSIVLIYYLKTTIFFNNGKFDVLFHSDTGMIFKGDWFYGTAADLRHFLFRNFMSPFVFPIKVLLGGDVLQQHPTIYGLYLANLQSLFMAVNTFFVLKLLKNFNVTKMVRIFLGIIFIPSWQQIFFAVNIERYFLGQFSLLLFLLLVHIGKTKSIIMNGLSGVLLIGTTVTNIYLYLVNLLIEKISIRKKFMHLFGFGFIFYFLLLFGGGGGPLLSALNFFSGYTNKFTDKYSLLELPGKIFANLLYPTLFPPLVDPEIKDALFQSGEVKLIPAILVVLALIACAYTIWKYRKFRLPVLLGFILLANLVLHGLFQFGLNSAALYNTHFNFTIILLLGLFSTLINKKYLKWLYAFFGLILAFSLIETFSLYQHIYEIGLHYYPR